MEPMAWISDFMWWLCDTLGTVMTVTGLAGLLLLTGYGLVSATEYLIDKEDLPHENQD